MDVIENPYQNPGPLPSENPFLNMPASLKIGEINQSLKKLIKEASEDFKEAKQFENKGNFYKAAIKKRNAGEKYLKIAEVTGYSSANAERAFKHSAATIKKFQNPYQIIFSADCLEMALKLKEKRNEKNDTKDLVDVAKLWKSSSENGISKITVHPLKIELLNKPDIPKSCSEKASIFFKKASESFEDKKNYIDAAKYRELAADFTNNFEQSIDLYREARSIYSSNNLNDCSGKIYYKEQQAIRLLIGYKTPFSKYFNIKWIIHSLYKYICGYGERPINVVISTLIIIIFFSFSYMFLGINYKGNIIRRTLSFNSKQFFNTLLDWSNCLYFSTVTFTTLGYGDCQPYGFSKIFASVEALIGAFLIAVFIFTWARKLQR